jgi:hypothetical protein
MGTARMATVFWCHVTPDPSLPAAFASRLCRLSPADQAQRHESSRETLKMSCFQGDFGSTNIAIDLATQVDT